MTTESPPGGVVARARAWRDATYAAVCDVVEPWAHGTVLRATRYPSYFDFNTIRVEDDPAMSVEALVAFADEALAGLEHRRIDFELAGAAGPLRAGFEARGWEAMRLLWMRYEAGPGRAPDLQVGRAPDLQVAEVAYDAVHELRVAWLREDFPDQDATGYHSQAREVALSRGVRVLAARAGAVPVAFAQLERDGPAAEITQVYVHPNHRGTGCGSAIIRAAIQSAGDARDVWICADDEDRAKELYARLGFRPVSTAMQFLRAPG